MTVLMNPDCLDQKHRACSGDGWCEGTDQAVPCPCECHQPKECYPGCPHPPCVNIRAAQPVATAMQAKHLSGASIGKLVEWEVGKSVETNEIQWSPAVELLSVGHFEGTVAIGLYWGNDIDTGFTATDHDLTPNDWVRITQVAA